MSGSTHRSAWLAVVTFVRWWFGATYFVGGIGGFMAGPIMIAAGNWGGLYMMLGCPIISMTGWLIHPWGLQRRRGTANNT